MRISMICLCSLALSLGCNHGPPGKDRGGASAPQAAAEKKPAPGEEEDEAGNSGLSNERRMELAIEAATDQRFGVAINQLQKLLIVDSENSKAAFLLARCYAGERDLSKAVEVLESIPTSDPDFGVPSLGQSAEYLSMLGRTDESIAKWNALLTVDPQMYPARSKLAIDLYRQGRRTEAAVELQKLAVAGVASQDELRRLLNPIKPPPSRQELMLRAKQGGTASTKGNQLGDVWELISQRRYREAMSTYQRLPSPVNLQGRVLQAWLASELMDFDLATKLLSQLEKEAQQFPAYWLAVGAIHESELRIDHALASYLRAMRLDPTREATHDRLSAVLLKRGEVASARSVDERRFTLAGPAEAVLAIGPGQPDDAQACQAMIEDLVQLGRYDQAACWLGLVADRHRTLFGNREQVTQRMESWRSIPISQRYQRWTGDADTSELPDPMLSFDNAIKPKVGGGNDLPSEADTIQFADMSSQLGVDFRYQNAPTAKSRLLRLYEQLGGGVVAMDYDRDGDADLYYSQAGGDPPSKVSQLSNELFRNDGEVFRSVTLEAGLEDDDYSLGVAYGDWNQDGFWDIVVGNFGKNRLLINQGDGTFVDWSDHLANETAMMTSSVGIADVDGDRLPDLVEVNYVDDESVYQPVPVNSQGFPAVYLGPNKYRSGIDRIGFGESDGTTKINDLVDVTRQGSETVQSPKQADGSDKRGVPQLGDAAQPGLGLLIGDLDSSPGLEFFVANDARPNQFWRTEVDPAGQRMAYESATVRGLATSGQGKSTASMGIGVGDLDRDGLTDMIVTNWYDEWSNVYQQSEGGSFMDRAPQFGMDQYSDRHVGFGVSIQDFDNDRWMDTLIGNGHVDDFSNQGIPQEMPTQILRNVGARFLQTDVNAFADGYFRRGHITRCVIAADLNRDGKQDVVTTDLIGKSGILINQSVNENHWIQFELSATQSERSAVGARVVIREIEPVLSQSVIATAGYMGRGESVLHFGLGENAKDSVDVEVSWPSGSRQTFRSLAVDQRHLLVENTN